MVGSKGVDSTGGGEECDGSCELHDIVLYAEIQKTVVISSYLHHSSRVQVHFIIGARD